MRLEGTLMDLAAEIGLTHEVLYRTLAALRRRVRSPGPRKRSFCEKSPAYDFNHMRAGSLGIGSLEFSPFARGSNEALTRAAGVAAIVIALAAASAFALVEPIRAAPAEEGSQVPHP